MVMLDGPDMARSEDYGYVLKLICNGHSEFDIEFDLAGNDWNVG